MRSKVRFSAVLFAASVAAYAEGPAFDAASVTLTSPDLRPPYVVTGGPGTADPGIFRDPFIYLEDLIGLAFAVDRDQIVGPAWLRDLSGPNHFTVVASMPPTTTKERFEKMLQNLLVERFHLAFHHETRKVTGYGLVVDKGGPKFKEVTPTENQAATEPPSGRGPDGFAIFPGPRTINQYSRQGGLVRTKYQERTMAEFVRNLGGGGGKIGSAQGRSLEDGYPQPRVVDKTGLTGKYTFILEYYDAGDVSRARTSVGPPPAIAAEPEGGPSIFTAIRDLGLRLDKTEDIPVDVIVVESVDKLPTPN